VRLPAEDAIRRVSLGLLDFVPACRVRHPSASDKSRSSLAEPLFVRNS